ncbi:NAD(+) synthase [Erysipelothrix rhusiopathiae]|nr:NAD(+) synthase [Erysipelothrix rhusiopathiae]MDE8060706.1 NAD(+) synthase [Erysipelothrix rhusiopathiae]MDE8069099.1 NAD(+) synthase [Erysipelothrix rhusiopathiae]MDE8079285.1 NAD(+) synthase [Erysipelothrix rhusiopathiae]MDE8084389.1 NAD(+) synthase [Erysipelothrix rhusiopathiae]
MKIAIAQLRVKANNPQANFEMIQEIVEKSKGKADLIVFPELAVGGYLVGDRMNNQSNIDELMAYNDRIRLLSDDIGIVWGNIYQKNDRLYNAAFFAYKGEWVERANHESAGVYMKHLLPNYGIFDDKRYFEPGDHNFEPFIFKGDRISIQVCEDLWDKSSDLKPTELMMQHSPDLMINISCSPWHKHKESMRLEEIRRQNLDIPFIYVNATGMQNNGKNVVLFDGGSMVVSSEAVTYLDANFKQTFDIVDLKVQVTNKPNYEDKMYQALISAIRYFDEEALSYGPKWIVGVSGGLDSSVSIALLVKALGKDRVVGVTMPSQFNRYITKNNAYHLSKVLGFKFLEIPIAAMTDATVESMKFGAYSDVTGLAFENVQARLRGHTLMTISSLENGVVMNNGNKIEVALGYATLYGDAIGALAILGDLTKMEVGMIGRTLNRIEGQEIVPENLIPVELENRVDWEFAPSAELAQDQFDPMKWGYHDLLIDELMHGRLGIVLNSYLDGSIYESNLGKYLASYGLDKGEAFVEDIQWVLKTMNTAVYKRVQMPPIVMVSNCAFGTVYRESQLRLHLTQTEQNLMNQIKNL